ncbi:hypothetical protein HWA77_17005 [Photobacterium damselae subsp. damselae]|uniref:Uncharacterized protein n=1 Tax=Photobacterium damselae subsp. damselae TaxID=85581 RepID=A0A850QTE0_PHODD|nr:hypothetical protein [Photobacterium damselae subsp. damselae]
MSFTLLSSVFTIAFSVLLKKLLELYLPNPTINKDHYYLGLLKNEYKHSYELFYSFGCPSKLIYNKVMKEKDPIELVYLLDKYSKFYSFSDGGISIRGQMILETKGALHLFRYLYTILTLILGMNYMYIQVSYLLDLSKEDVNLIFNSSILLTVIIFYIFHFYNFGFYFIKHALIDSSKFNEYKKLVDHENKTFSNMTRTLIILGNFICIIVLVILMEITQSYYVMNLALLLPIIPTIIEIFFHKKGRRLNFGKKNSQN